MAQALPRFCPRCGTQTRANMRICPNCGLPAEAMLSRAGNIQGSRSDSASEEPASETARIVPSPAPIQQGNQGYRSPMPPVQDFKPAQGTPGQPQPSSRVSSSPAQNLWDALIDIDEMPTQVVQESVSSQPGQRSWNAPQSSENAPEPDEMPTRLEASLPQPSTAQSQWNAPGGTRPMSGSPIPRPSVVQPPPLPAYTPPSLAPRRKRPLAVVGLLLVLFFLGISGYVVYSLTGGHFPGLTASQSPSKTTKLNFPVNYAGIDITVTNIQQAQNFLDDPQTASNGMLRVNLQEQNKTHASISWNYNQSARLLPQGGAPIKPVYVKSKGLIAPGATENSSIDFPIANGGDLNKLVFQLGTSNEAQIEVPLAGQAGIDKYRPQTSKQNGTLVYFGLNWTLTSATTSLSIPGQQAPNGMEFLTVTLKVDNTLSQEAITGSPFDYLRVMAGGKTVSPVDTTLPVSFATGEMGKMGTATFLIPSNSSACTLILLSQDPGASGQATTNFRVN